MQLINWIFRRSQTSSEEVEKLTPVEEEKLTEGLIINGLENSNEVKTLTPKCENVSSTDLIHDTKYLNLLNGKETDL